MVEIGRISFWVPEYIISVYLSYPYALESVRSIVITSHLLPDVYQLM